MSENCEVVGAVILSVAALVLIHDHIKGPVQAIFDPPNGIVPPVQSELLAVGFLALYDIRDPIPIRLSAPEFREISRI